MTVATWIVPFASTGDIEICYETFGDRSDPAMLLIMGFTAQMTTWDESFCHLLAERGHYVIRFDNRDCGLSTKLDGVPVDIVAALMAMANGSAFSGAPYDLSAFAADSVGLLDHLGIDRAHVVGASMGGMIAQTMAIEQPHRLLTMTSIMSATGEPEFTKSAPEAQAALLSLPPADRDEYIQQSIATAKIFCSPRYFDAEQAASRAAKAYDRSYYPEGAARQLAAMIASGSRGEALPEVSVPTLVIHGRADKLILPIGGDRTAELIRGARLLMVNDMGHDLPIPLWPILIDAIASHTQHRIG